MFKVSEKNIRIGAQKARLVADLVRGKSVNEALRILSFCPQKGAAVLKRLVLNGVANANSLGGVDVDSLYIAELCVDMGSSLVRFRPRAQGRATPVRKKTSHINLILGER